MTKQLTFVESAAPGVIKESSDGTYPVVLIAPGQGSSGYYSEELIARDAPQAWPKGTHVYLDHLKEGETRSPAKLLGFLTEETQINEDGEAVNRFKPLSKHSEWIEEVRPYVGMSISARGGGVKGTIDGRETLIVESLEPHITNTVDIVSYAGRGGRFLESFLEEANASEGGTSTQHESSAGATKGNSTMTLEEQVAALLVKVGELVTKIDARESAEAARADADRDAKAEVASAVAATRAVESADATASVKDKLVEGILEGNYDVTAALEADKQLREEIRAELSNGVNLNEGVGSSASGAGSEPIDLTVKGW